MKKGGAMPRNPRRSAIFTILLLLCLAEIRHPQLALGDTTSGGLKFIGNTTLVLDPACNACEGATMDLKLLVTSSKFLPGDLTVSGLISETTKEAANVAVSLQDVQCASPNEGQTGKTATSCLTGAVVTAQLKVKGIVGTGKWQATIKNGDAEAGKVEITNPAVPWKIKLVTPDAANPKIVVTRGENASFNLQNDNRSGYLVARTLSAGGKLFTPPTPSATDKIPPRGTH